MTGNELRKALQSGQRVYGTLVVSTSTKWPLALSNTGVDFVFIDTEHIAIGRETLSWMCRTYAAMGMPPIVRIPSHSPIDACIALDGGANGIIAPYVETAEQVRALVGAVKLRPLKGVRMRAALDDPETLNAEVRNYLAEFNANNLLIVNIESAPAIENLDEILRVPGLDGVLIGPHDLSVNLGIPEQYASETFDRAVREIITRARSHNVAAGFHFCHEQMAGELDWIRAGVNLVIHDGDISLFEHTLRSDLIAMRQALGEKVISGKGHQAIVI